MGSRPNPIQQSSGNHPLTRKTRRRRSSTRRTTHCGGGGGDRAPPAAYSSVSEKLEALKQLIPAFNGERKTEQLFEETADYIVLLRTQVSILQKLIDIYASNSNNLVEIQNA